MFFEKLKSILKYLIPIFYYAILFYLFSIISNLQLGIFESLKVTFLNKTIAIMFCKYFVVMFFTGLFFTIFSTLQIKSAIDFIFRGPNLFTTTIFLFLTFIPMIFEMWDELKKAWKIRGGRVGLKMCVVLLPSLILLSFKKAYDKAKAIGIIINE